MKKRFLTIFTSTFMLSAFTFGGGYVIIPLMRRKFVEELGWIEEQEMLDMTAIAQSCPGPMAVNASILVGYHVAGIPGALVATAGCVLPSCVIVMLLAYIYHRYRGLSVVQGILGSLRPAVVAMIASAGLSLLIMAFYGQRALPADLLSIDLVAVGIFAVCFFVLRKWKLNPIAVMAAAGVAGVILYTIL